MIDLGGAVIDWAVGKILDWAWNTAKEYITRTPIDEIREYAEKGYAQAQYCLGFIYYKGYNVNKNYVEALYWWRRSAEEQNYAKAQYVLGGAYY